MFQDHQSVGYRRSMRREAARRTAVRTTAWLLTLLVGLTGGWLIRGETERTGELRRPAPERAPVTPPAAIAPQEPLAPELLPLSQAHVESGKELMDEPTLTGSLAERLTTLHRAAPGPNSIWFYDLNNNEAISVQGEAEYPAASTAKVPIVMYLYHQVATNKLSLTQRVLVQTVDWAPGTGVLQAVKAGQPFSLRELARLALVHSDNIATNMLLRTLGSKALVSYLQELGIRHDRDQNLISPQDLGLAFRHLWRMAKKYPYPWEEPLLFLQQNVFHDRLPAGVPEGVPIANKIGSVDRAFHDAGIVYHPTNPYILVVMTDGMGEQQAARFISRVSREVWRWQDDGS